MALYRLTLRLTSPLGTPLASPTLFGMACWAIRELHGQQHLAAWLEDGQARWRLSDAFPHDCLPKPLMHPRPLPQGKALEEVKTRRKRTFISRQTWLTHRDNWNEFDIPLDDLHQPRALPGRLAHNVVHRSGQGTLEEGGLFFVDEDWRHADDENAALVDVYVETSDALDEVRQVFAHLGERGYGRDASTGRGRWQVEQAEEEQKLQQHSGARRMSLSRGALDTSTMRDALWKLEAHYGKLGPELSLFGISPFKRPLLLTRPGMTFTPAHADITAFGKMLKGIHPQRPEVVLDARHIVIPFNEAA